MDDDFKEEMQEKIFHLLVIDNNDNKNCYNLIDECIEYGRDNPKTCRYEQHGLGVVLTCSNCKHSTRLVTFSFCPYCGRKIENYSKN